MPRLRRQFRSVFNGLCPIQTGGHFVGQPTLRRTQIVDAGRLSPAEDPGECWESRCQGGRLRHASEDEKWREQKHDGEVRKLLQRIEWVVGGWRWPVQGEVRRQRVEGVWDDAK